MRNLARDYGRRNDQAMAADEIHRTVIGQVRLTIRSRILSVSMKVEEESSREALEVCKDFWRASAKIAVTLN
jgi:hypothetical protein